MSSPNAPAAPTSRGCRRSSARPATAQFSRTTSFVSARPVRLRGRIKTCDRRGQRRVWSTDTEPDGVLRKACGEPPRGRLPAVRRALPRRRLPAHRRRPGVRADDVQSAGAQLAAAAAAVALLASIPVFLFPKSAELAVVELSLSALIGLIGFAVARGAGATHPRALAYALSVLVIAVAIAGLKNGLAGH